MNEHHHFAAYAESRLPHLGTYRRDLPVNLERMYENTLDWEHLPHVHNSTFTAIECEDYGTWGWRARVQNHQGDWQLLELRLEKALHRWVTRTLEGRFVGSEIWTHAFSISERRIEVVIDFFIPGVSPEHREKLRLAYSRVYQRLYDEDLSMMAQRQRQLDRRVESRKHAAQTLHLGRLDKLELPARVELLGREFLLVEDQGELCCFPALCPHLLGPLAQGQRHQGVVECPWHGYRFDIRSGACVSGQNCRFAGPRPDIRIDPNSREVTLTLSGNNTAWQARRIE